jgi:hypothetical protein
LERRIFLTPTLTGDECATWRFGEFTLAQGKLYTTNYVKNLLVPRASLVDYDKRKTSSPCGESNRNLVSVATELPCSLFNDAVRNFNVHNVNNLKKNISFIQICSQMRKYCVNVSANCMLSSPNLCRIIRCWTEIFPCFSPVWSRKYLYIARTSTRLHYYDAQVYLLYSVHWFLLFQLLHLFRLTFYLLVL